MALMADHVEEADRRYDATLAGAVGVILDEDESLLETSSYFSQRLSPEAFIDHLVDMVRLADGGDSGKINAPLLGRGLLVSDTTARAILDRHPLIPRVQAVRAALELSNGKSNAPLVGIIRVFAGVHPTTMKVRGVHRSKPTSRTGRQLHLEFAVVTEAGRVVLVNTERYAVADATWEEMRAAGKEAVEAARAEGIADAGLLRERWDGATVGFQRRTWDERAMWPIPQTVAEHVGALVEGATRAAALVGAPDLSRCLPVVGGQLVASTKAGMLPAEPVASLVSHDVGAVDQLMQLGVMPVLDLNGLDGVDLRAMNEVPFTVKLARADGEVAPHRGPELLAQISDPSRATPVERDRLGVRSPFALAVSYVDGEVDLPGGPCAVRVYYRAGYRVPHSVYLVPMVPGDIDTHIEAVRAIVFDSTSLHGATDGLMGRIRESCERKGAFDPGGERASPTECLATIARLAADRELHRSFAASY
jgi:hypothetical protein